MGVTTEMRMVFAREKHARWAHHVAEGIIKASYLDVDLYDAPAGGPQSLAQLWEQREDELKALDFAESALASLERRGTQLVVDRCQDVQGSLALKPEGWRDEVFPQLCLAYTTRFPQVPYVAYCRHEQTTSGFVQHTRVSYDAVRMRWRQVEGERPFDENAWDAARMLDVRVEDGRFVADEEALSPTERHFRALLAEAQEARVAGDARGALQLADAASALAGRKDRPEPVALRALAARHLHRLAVRRVLDAGFVDEDVAARLDEAAVAREGKDVPLGEGRFVLGAWEGGFRISDTRDGSVVARVKNPYSHKDEVRVLDDFRVVLDSGGALPPRQHLVDWDFAVWHYRAE